MSNMMGIMNVAEWQKRLGDNFKFNDIIGGNLIPIFEMEKSCGNKIIEKYHGQNVLIDSFQGFFIETIQKTLNWIQNNGWPLKAESYPQIVLYYIVMFRSFRACENLVRSGYPLDGYGLLRDLKDRAIFLAGIAHNITTFSSIFGYQGETRITAKEYQTIKNRRKREELRVFKKMIRAESGLREEVVRELNEWEQMFHDEVHGSKFTFFEELGSWAKDKVPLTIGPKFKESSIAIYMNRSTEIAWLIVRLLPYLQPKQDAFGENWEVKYKILDESFRFAQNGLAEAGKKIGEIFIEFVEKKFSFDEPFHFFEATGEN